MKYVDANGIKIPALGFGTFRLKGDACASAVTDALKIGYRHLDTAEIYENEADVGRGIQESGVPRGELFLTTKAWMDDLSEDGVARSLDGSLRALDVECIDLWLVHWPNPRFKIEETIEAMMKHVAAGTVRAVGVSNFPAVLHARAAAVGPIACNQVEYHPYLAQDVVLNAAQETCSMLMAYSPLAKGACQGDHELARIGSRYEKSASQVALRWLVQQSSVGAIPKASQRAHIAENFEIFDFQLTADEMRQIHALAMPDGRMTNPDIAPQWDA